MALNDDNHPVPSPAVTSTPGQANTPQAAYVLGLGDDLGPRRRGFAIKTDPKQEDRATEIKVLSTARPHMRAFHFAWLSFFAAFFGWFSIPPLMPTIKKQLHLTKGQVDNSNIVSVASTIVARLIAGPLCDHYGSRTVQTILLVLGAIPVASAAFINSYAGLMAVRFFIGLVGSTFIPTAYWTSVMFAKEVVGSANAIAAGWGNLGAGATYLITPLLFDLVTINGTVSDDMGWRITLLFPAIFMVIVGVALFRFSDDCPQGNYKDLRQVQTGEIESARKTKSVDAKVAMLAACKLPAVWVLAFQYACSFGVELQVHNVLSLYYYEDFVRGDGCDPETDANECRVLTQTRASLISSLFGIMCIFARAAGGYASDLGSRRWGMKGRLGAQFVAFAGQATFLFIFSHASSVAVSIPCLIVFGIFVQACTGSSYGIVPYLAPEFTGATSGIVGAGGNIGALCWGFLFKGVGDRALSFQYLSAFVAVSALLTPLIRIKDDAATSSVDKPENDSTTTIEYEDNAASSSAPAPRE